MKIREAIDRFLRSRVSDSPVLIPRWSTALETQLMTTRGTACGDRAGEWIEDGEVWANTRWPHKAGTDPHFHDWTLTFDPAKRITRIGTTWWNWETRKSVAVGIDIDVAEGHAESTVTVTQEQLSNLVDKLATLPYVTMVRSTSGRGIHVYVFFDENDQPVANTHHEHADNARRVLVKIETDLGISLSNHVDCVGSMFWLWANQLSADSFSLVVDGGRLAGSAIAGIEVPEKARNFVAAVDWDSSKVTESHRSILQDIASQGYYFLWKEDVGLCHTHTKAIEAVFRERAAAGTPLHGKFETSSRGSDPMTPNCFITPSGSGAFRVTRFGNGCQESTWSYDNGSNYTFINEPTCPLTAVREVSTGIKKGRYQLDREGIEALAEMLGESFPSLPDRAEAVVNRDNTISLFTAEHSEGWTASGKSFEMKLKEKHKPDLSKEQLLRKADTIFRFVLSPEGKPIGWYLKTQSGWVEFHSWAEISTTVQQHFGDLWSLVKAMVMDNPWKLDFKPFAGEYPGDRKWNKDAPQFAVEPNVSGGDHPTIDKVFGHIGASLDKSVQEHPWCRKNGITSGKLYLQAWLASVIQYPDQILPYLFLVGPQASGKSVFHELMAMLFTCGVQDGGSALTSSAGHNHELANSVVVYLEEKDLSQERTQTYARIKEWVTSRTITVHRKYHTPYTQPNMLHFVQMGNHCSNLPLEDGDTRVVVIDVPAIKEPVAKMIFEQQLKREIGSFLRTLLNTKIGEPCDRMRIPTITSPSKEDMLAAAMSGPIRACHQSLEQCPGAFVKLTDVYEAYKHICEEEGTRIETLRAFRREVLTRSDRYLTGEIDGETCIGNYRLKDAPKTKNPGGQYELSISGKLEWTPA
jgi:hypothetical protein